MTHPNEDTMIGRHTEGEARDPAEYGRRQHLCMMAQVANHLLDKLTPRQHEAENAELLPPEPDED